MKDIEPYNMRKNEMVFLPSNSSNNYFWPIIVSVISDYSNVKSIENTTYSEPTVILTIFSEFEFELKLSIKKLFRAHVGKNYIKVTAQNLQETYCIFWRV